MEAIRKLGWSAPLNLLVTVAVAAWIPVRIVFFDRLPAADFATDAFVAMLVIITRFTPKKSAEKDRSEPSAWKKWSPLVFDLALGLPLVSLLDVVGYPFKGLFLLKLIILRRLGLIRAILDCYDSVHPVVHRLLPLAFTMPTVIHLIACGWVWLGCGTVGTTDDKFFDYGRSVYWAITTLTTVGYGDISGKSLPQMAYCCVTMIIGVGFFGYVLSNVASLLARLDAAREAHLSLLDKVEAFMRYNEVPSPIRLKIRAYYRYLWESRRGFDDSFILEHLPTKLRGEVSLFLNAEMIEKVPLFKGADPELIQDIVLQLKPLVIVPGEKIFHAGEPGDAMYFIYRGPVEILSRDGKLLATLQSGSFFGEMALLTSNPRNASARAGDYCDLFVLKREAFESVLHRYPNFEKYIREIAAQRAAPPAPTTPPSNAA